MTKIDFFKFVARLLVVASSVFVIEMTNGQQTSTITTSALTTTATPPESLDATAGGTIGNPGAQIRFSTKALDSIYSHALIMIARAVQSMAIPDVVVPIAGGMLTIKSSRVTEAKIPNFERQLLPPNRIRSRLTGGKIAAIGEWQYKPFGGDRTTANGIFRTIVVDAELNVTNQLSRTWDAKPIAQTTHCKADLAQFRVEIDGFGDDTTVIEQCQNLMCERIRNYFEDAVCSAARNYIKDEINQKLSTFPTRINLGGVGKQFVLDYGLIIGDPKVNEQFIQSYLEGDVLSRGSGSAPFHANALSFLNDRPQMISFSLSDYAFNTLLYHAHNQQFRFSAFDSLPASSSIKELLKMNCSTPPPPPPADARRRLKSARTSDFSTPACLGSIFDARVCIGACWRDHSPPDAVGDLVFKSQRPLQVVVRQSPEKSLFGVDGGSLEAYGPPAGKDGKRELLARVDIQYLRGEFVPNLNASNITGSINITNLQLTQSSPPATRSRIRSLDGPTLNELTKLASPILTEMLNAFLNQFAQFPVPLVDGYECASPEFRWTERTMQIDCDVRVSPDATRKG